MKEAKEGEEGEEEEKIETKALMKKTYKREVALVKGEKEEKTCRSEKEVWGQIVCRREVCSGSEDKKVNPGPVMVSDTFSLPYSGTFW